MGQHLIYGGDPIEEFWLRDWSKKLGQHEVEIGLENIQLKKCFLNTAANNQYTNRYK